LFVVCVVAGVAVAAILLAHGANWWSAPIAIVGSVIVGHLAVLLALLVVAMLITHSGHRHDVVTRGDLLRRPRLYDWMVGVIAGGHERSMREGWLDVAELQTGEAVLDVGSGTGSLLLAAARRVGPTGTLRGLEASPEMVSRAREKARAAGVEVEFASGSADALPYPDHSFDAVFSTLVFHHLPADMQESALAEIVRVLRPGGRVIIVDLPHRGQARGRLRSLLEIMHSGKRGRVIDVGKTLEALGARELTLHPAGMRALQVTRAVFS
jgi:ubiquinone/menaquinone biosynthesis C-methylase UbiE